MMTKMKTGLLVAVSSVFLTMACTDDEKKLEEPIKTSEDQSKHDFTVDDDGNVNFKLEIVYFNYDDYTLTQAGMDRLNVLADYLKKHPSKKLQIEGHCDERGSVEYNLALGQNRAESVKKYLNTIGLSDARIGTVSFGEEKPASDGHSEEAWSQNRRAEFKFVDSH